VARNGAGASQTQTQVRVVLGEDDDPDRWAPPVSASGRRKEGCAGGFGPGRGEERKGEMRGKNWPRGEGKGEEAELAGSRGEERKCRLGPGCKGEMGEEKEKE
jgi:hypothetical protein